MVKNVGMRALIRLQFNSLWGKLGQRHDMSVKKYINPKDWFKIFKLHVDNKINLKHEKKIDDNTLFVDYCECVEEKQACRLQALLAPQ